MPDPQSDDDALLDEFFSAMTPDWTSNSGTEADGRRYITVPVTKLYNDPLYGKLRGVRVDQGTTAWLRLVMYSEATGAPLTISLGNYSTPPAVEVKYREASGYDSRAFTPDTAAELASDGRSLLLPIPQEVSNCPAIYTVQSRVLNSTGDEVNRSEASLLVDRGLWTTTGDTPQQDRGPPTVSEVRTRLRDHPGVNRLLGNFSIDYAEIAQAIVLAVQRFNQEPPAGGRSFTTNTFPGTWRQQWMDGILAYLYETLAEYHRRGHLSYSASGLNVDDLDKEKTYLQAAQMHRERYERWVKITRMRASVAAGWGSIGGYGVYGSNY